MHSTLPDSEEVPLLRHLRTSLLPRYAFLLLPAFATLIAHPILQNTAAWDDYIFLLYAISALFVNAIIWVSVSRLSRSHPSRRDLSHTVIWMSAAIALPIPALIVFEPSGCQPWEGLSLLLAGAVVVGGNVKYIRPLRVPPIIFVVAGAGIIGFFAARDVCPSGTAGIGGNLLEVELLYIGYVILSSIAVAGWHRREMTTGQVETDLDS